MSCQNDDSVLISVTYKPVIPLAANEVEWNGEIFNCFSCSAIGCCGAPGVSAPCKKCGCQDRVGAACDVCPTDNCTGYMTNKKILGPQTTRNMTCTEACALIDSGAEIINLSAITTICNAATRLQCCKGELPQEICQTYWGPDKNSGNCDGIMNTYCKEIDPNSSACECINSDLPLPECVDNRCANTDAFKTLKMKQNRCQVNLQVCQQFVNISSDAKNNLWKDSPIVQACQQTINPNQTNGLPEWAFILIIVLACVIVLALFGYGGYSYYKMDYIGENLKKISKYIQSTGQKSHEVDYDLSQKFDILQDMIRDENLSERGFNMQQMIDQLEDTALKLDYIEKSLRREWLYEKICKMIQNYESVSESESDPDYEYDELYEDNDVEEGEIIDMIEISLISSNQTTRETFNLQDLQATTNQIYSLLQSQFDE